MQSLPSRERGLKFKNLLKGGKRGGVAPLAGAWIEISWPVQLSCGYPVAPLAGAWIEIVRGELRFPPN